MADAPKQTNLTITAPPNPFNVQDKKTYVFNETGNVMIAKTVEKTSGELPNDVRKQFQEVAVFFATMTKAISETINPKTGANYNLYDYDALSNIISGSGLFIHVTEEDIHVSSTSFGMDFSKALLD